MNLYDKLMNKEISLSVIGLGYVGMPLAVEFSKHFKVIGYDSNEEKVATYRRGVDPTQEVGDLQIKCTDVNFTSNEDELKLANFHIIAVPTPINIDKSPDLSPVISASKVLGKNLKANSIVVYESTVYPGVTEDVCIPILEKESGLQCGKDFKVGYSPERINPGDKVHRLTNIKKIVSGQDNDALENIKNIYATIIEAGVYPVSSIKVAEAAKVVENSQRDINIAFMNELAMVFDKMDIDTNEVVSAMNTKWNALKFTPGLVGGHCIGIDPYYFIYEAEKLGYHSQIIASGRKVNDGMGSFIADAIIKNLILENYRVRMTKVLILGLTFKENCPDIRNTKVIDIIKKLNECGIEPMVSDPYANKEEAQSVYGIQLVNLNEVTNVDCVVVAVAHDEYKNLNLHSIFKKKGNQRNIVIDVKSIMNKDDLMDKDYVYWNL